jgi:hypothetical protein
MSQPPRFTWKTADGAEHSFDMVANEIAIGRAPTCDIVLNDDQMVSRRHAIVRKQGNTITVVDLGSSNGTLVNGAEIHDATVLKDGDRVTIGDHDLLFSAAKEAVQVAAPSAPVVETIRIGGNSAPMAAPTPSFLAPTEAPPPPLPFGSAPTPFDMPAAPSAFPFGGYSPMDAVAEQDTGAIGMAIGQEQSSYVHTVNGKEVEREDASHAFQSQYVAEAAAPPARPDATMLLATIQTLHDQLNDQIVMSNDAAEQVRSGIRAALEQLQSALIAAQSAAQQAALADLSQLAQNVSQSPLVDQVASFARRATEIHDVLVAHQSLLEALKSIRQELETTLNR